MAINLAGNEDNDRYEMYLYRIGKLLISVKCMYKHALVNDRHEVAKNVGVS